MIAAADYGFQVYRQGQAVVYCTATAGALHASLRAFVALVHAWEPASLTTDS